MMRHRHLLLLLMAVVVVGCGDQASSPVPQPVPGLIRQSTPKATAIHRLVVGLSGAVAGVGRVHLVGTGKVTVVSSTQQGTFAAVLVESESLDLQAWFETADGVSQAVPLQVRVYGPLLGLGQPQPGVVAPQKDGEEEVVVSNDGGVGLPLLMDAPADTTVVVSNLDNSVVVSTTTDKDGKFSTRIKATTGDVVQIMLVSSDDPAVSSDFVSITVP